MTPLFYVDCVNHFLQEAQRLGVEVHWANEGMAQLEAAYHARPGVPGLLLLSATTPRPRPQQLCTLLAHEMVHVLQHWKGQLRATPPLGWPVDGAPPGRSLSQQEAEAYTAQKQPRKVLEAVHELKPITAGCCSPDR